MTPGSSAEAAPCRARVVREPIDLDALVEYVGSPGAGAVATFSGVVRDHHEGKQVSFLEYDAYEPMARRVMQDIAEEAWRRWQLEGIAVDHRVGRLEIGEVSVALAVSSAHRAEAFEAARFAIDELKLRAPVWKRESGPDGTFWIEGPDHVRANS